jgi:hypothetical protein
MNKKPKGISKDRLYRKINFLLDNKWEMFDYTKPYTSRDMKQNIPVK